MKPLLGCQLGHCTETPDGSEIIRLRVLDAGLRGLLSQIRSRRGWDYNAITMAWVCIYIYIHIYIYIYIYVHK